MTPALSVALAWCGAAIALHRLRPAPARDEAPAGDSWPKISIIIPARNEEKNLPPLLDSLRAVDYPSFEVMVVDDGSTDRTAEIARSYGGQVLSAPPLPAGWNPKNWACHNAVAHASGELLLFTDADTVYRPDGLRRALNEWRRAPVDLMSCLPYHRAPTWWEKLLGPFHALVLVATAPRTPAFRRLYAVGQFLLFDRAFYERSGGHAAVAAEYPDDLALANRCLKSGGRYVCFTGTPFFEVRMYASFSEFIAGWRRNFQAGLRQSRAAAAFEVALVVMALLAGGHPAAGAATVLPAIITLGAILARQRAWGDFSTLGVLLFPFALLVHVAVTALALLDWARGGALQWKNRELKNWTSQTR